jgi:uncharacterized protein (DUF362 family)
MDRREFIKSAALAGAGVVVMPGLARDAFATEGDGPMVVMAKGPTPAKLARAAVDALGGMQSFIRKGDTVVVKPNIGWDRTPEQAATTHPDVVAEVVLMCLAAGAAKVKVFDRTCNDARRCYTQSGIGPALSAIKDPRLEVTHIDDRKFRTVDIPGGRMLTRWSVYEEVLDADKFINLPIAKHHSAAVLTIGMKNVMGVIGSNRAVLHKGIHEALPDLNRAVKSHLTIVDATRVLIANGPQGGRLEDVRRFDTVVAGRDIVAVDTVAGSLFGKGPGEVRYLQIAHDSGLGVADMRAIRLKKVAI